MILQACPSVKWKSWSSNTFCQGCRCWWTWFFNNCFRLFCFWCEFCVGFGTTECAFFVGCRKVNTQKMAWKCKSRRILLPGEDFVLLVLDCGFVVSFSSSSILWNSTCFSVTKTREKRVTLNDVNDKIFAAVWMSNRLVM